MDTFKCFSLENAGLINSWILLCFLTGVETIIGYSFWWNVHECKTASKSYKASGCYEINSMSIMVSIAIVLFAWIIMCWLCIKGIERRNHQMITPLMIWEEIVCGASAFLMWDKPIYGFSILVVSFYIFMILHSLYLKFKKENEPPQTLHLTII